MRIRNGNVINFVNNKRTDTLTLGKLLERTTQPIPNQLNTDMIAMITQPKPETWSHFPLLILIFCGFVFLFWWPWHCLESKKPQVVLSRFFVKTGSSVSYVNVSMLERKAKRQQMFVEVTFKYSQVGWKCYFLWNRRAPFLLLCAGWRSGSKYIEQNG